MKKIITVLNIIIAIYFFGLANLYFWGSIGVMLLTKELPLGKLWLSLIDMISAPFLMYGSIIFFRKTEWKYLYGLVILSIVWIAFQVYRLIFVTHGRLETTGLSNILLFGFIFILFVKYLDKKLSK